MAYCSPAAYYLLRESSGAGKGRNLASGPNNQRRMSLWSFAGVMLAVTGGDNLFGEGALEDPRFGKCN